MLFCCCFFCWLVVLGFFFFVAYFVCLVVGFFLLLLLCCIVIPRLNYARNILQLTTAKRRHIESKHKSKFEDLKKNVEMKTVCEKK